MKMEKEDFAIARSSFATLGIANAVAEALIVGQLNFQWLAGNLFFVAGSIILMMWTLQMRACRHALSAMRRFQAALMMVYALYAGLVLYLLWPVYEIDARTISVAVAIIFAIVSGIFAWMIMEVTEVSPESEPPERDRCDKQQPFVFVRLSHPVLHTYSVIHPAGNDNPAPAQRPSA